jgi:DNA-3-methyladenine glycosylase I
MGNKEIKERCGWCTGDALYEEYHDKEWGKPVYDDQTLFELLILETMQAGLSWITILRKRENYRAALDGFDAQKIAAYDQQKIEDLLLNPGIIRYKLKVKSIVSNAQLFLQIQKEQGSFSHFIWKYVNHEPIENAVTDYRQSPANTTLSTRMAADLKKLGFKFVGSTTMYAFLQATGMVNDHEITCHRYDKV